MKKTLYKDIIGKATISVLGLSALLMGVYVSKTLSSETATSSTPTTTVQTAASDADLPMLPDFELQDHNKQPFTKDNLIGKHSLLFFGYTHCPDVCPMTMLHMQQTMQKLADKPAANDIQVVFISVDPYRDTPDVLKDYVSYFNSDFIGVSGAEKYLKLLNDTLGVSYERGFDYFNPGKYKMGHSAYVYLVDPKGKINHKFAPPHNPEQIALEIIKAHKDA